DVDASAIGCGATGAGAMSIVLGTYSINQVLGAAPLTDPRWQARAFVRPGQWLHMATSPAGAVCLDWAARRLGPLLPDGEPDLPAAVAEAVVALEADPAGFPLFLPFLYGLPHDPDAEGSWVGLRSGHGRGQLLAAVLEGVAFNHRTHVDALREVFPVTGPVRVCGGGARSRAWTQLLCDVLDLPVEVTDAHEAGARGAALLAGVGLGEFGDLDDAVARGVRVVRRQTPKPAQVSVRERRYQRYRSVADALGRTPVGCG
ncbi:MAG: FGGY-family carbohydrate kinase, partial [Actinomycetota bacterium]